MSKDELLVIDRTYELLKWFLGHLAKFPRPHRYGLGQRIETRLYTVFEGLVRAKYAGGSDKIAALVEVNEDLEIVRMLSRLAHELVLARRMHAVRRPANAATAPGGADASEDDRLAIASISSYPNWKARPGQRR